MLAESTNQCYEHRDRSSRDWGAWSMRMTNQDAHRTAKLLQHGEYLSPLCVPLPGQEIKVNTPEARPEGKGNVIRRYGKRVRASEQPIALGWISALYPNSVEYTARVESLRGLAFAAAWLVGGMMLLLAIGSGVAAYQSKDWFVWLLAVPLSAICLGAAAIQFVVLLKLELFHPSDQPIIFDRKSRKVYRLFQELPDGIRSLFRQRPMKACAYEWDLVDAEHQGEVMITGATAQSNHTLMFHVRRSENDPTIIDSFEIGNAMSLSGDLVDAMWEHIRRFMEEGGPHLPSLDEPLARQKPPQSWWQSLGATGFIGAGYLGRWERQPAFMALMHALAPVTVPLTLLWGTGNWLSHRTEVEVQWPDEVLAAVGSPKRVT